MCTFETNHRCFALGLEGLTGALRRLALQYGEGNTDIEFEGSDIPAGWLDETATQHLFAIARETMWNAVCHSQARKIRVVCNYAAEAVFLSVIDNVIGLIPATRSWRMGRLNMEYRARTIGADLRFRSVKGGGVSIKCKLLRPRAALKNSHTTTRA